MIFLLCALSVVNIALVVLVLRKNSAPDYYDDFRSLNSKLENILSLIREESRSSRLENSDAAKSNREEAGRNFKILGEGISSNIMNLAALQKAQLEMFAAKLQEFNESQRNKFNDLFTRSDQARAEAENKLEKIRETVENRLSLLQKENALKLDEMRATVDEKLHATVEKRFSESFQLISKQLESVHKGLGEMQSLASNVGDLKKVLSNVKTRGVVGEFQLSAILEEFLSPQQYERNACVKSGSQERVEYAVKLPSKNDNDEYLFLPIDSKFPNEDYQRLVEAYEKPGEMDVKQIELANKQFENSVKKNAKDIFEKYINPPATTDFALMFVPTEGLYAEIVKRGELFEFLHRNFKVIVVGPTNLIAFVNSLQIGFRTLGVEKRASEIWQTLGAIKTEFGKYGDVLEGVKKKLDQAAGEIDKVSVRSRAIERKLKNVEGLPENEAKLMLGEVIADVKEE